jgi:hypothetical protein
MIYELNENEKASLEAFLAHPKSKRLMNNEGTLALLFSRSSGIGVASIAKIRDKDGNETEANITDYEAW